MAWTNPKMDWDSNPKNPVAEDFNRIEGNLDYLKNDIETKKGAVVDALNSIGIATLISDTYVQIAAKIIGAEKKGVVITPGTSDQAIPKGIYNTGGGKVVGDTDLTSANIKAGINIFGISGKSSVVETSDATVNAGDMLSGKTGYKNGSKITGNIPSKRAATYTPGTSNQTISSGQYLSGTQTIKGDTNLVPGSIADGITIFGKTGTFPAVHTNTNFDKEIIGQIDNIYRRITSTAIFIEIVGVSNVDRSKFDISSSVPIYVGKDAKNISKGTSFKFSEGLYSNNTVRIFNPRRSKIVFTNDAYSNLGRTVIGEIIK